MFSVCQASSEQLTQRILRALEAVETISDRTKLPSAAAAGVVPAVLAGAALGGVLVKHRSK